MSSPLPANVDWVPLGQIGAGIAAPSTRVYRSANPQSIAPSSFVVASWEAAQYDIGAQWSAGQPTRLTCQIPGTYDISVQGSFQSVAGQTGNHRLGWLRLNGSQILAQGGASGMNYVGAGNPRVSCATTVRLVVGDYIEVLLFQDSGGANNWVARSTVDACDFTMALVDGGGPPGPKGDPGPAGASGTSYTLPGRLGTAAQQLPGGGYTNDWNSAVDNGWYMSSDAANAPVSGWLLGQTINHNGIWCRQEVHAFTDGNNVQPRWSRRQNAGSWGSWVQINPNLGPPDSGWIQTDVNTGYYGFYGAPYGPVYYRKLGNGMVTMRGLFTLPYQAPTYANFCTLPVGCRPSQPVYFRAACANNSALVISVNVDGQILPDATTPSGSWISMGCVNFYADQ